MPSASAQLALETVHLKRGKPITGEVVEVRNDAIVLTRKVGKGSVRQSIKFSRISSNSLHAILVSALSPLDGADHLRIARIVQAAGLYATAQRHFRQSHPAGSPIPADLASEIARCQAKDIEHLMKRSRDELAKEHFSAARRVAMILMRRHHDHPDATKIPRYLKTISDLYEAARKRDAAIARSRKAKDLFKRAEVKIGGVEKWIGKARIRETRGLNRSGRFSSARLEFESGIKFLGNAEVDISKIRQSKFIPAELRPKVRDLENLIIDLQIRLRLHIASQYTVRGSYGTALTYVNAALAYDPEDKNALNARARIEGAAAESGRIGRIRRIIR